MQSTNVSIPNSPRSLILLSILSLFGSTKAQETGLRGAGLICSKELELRITCRGACDIPPSSSPAIDLNYEVSIKSKTTKAWQLTQSIVQAGSLTRPHEVLPLPQWKNIDNGEPLRLPYSIKSDELIGETPLIQAIVSAATVGGGSCQLDTNTIEILSLSRPLDINSNIQSTPSGGRSRSQSMDEPQSQVATSFRETFTREITMFMNYEIGKNDRQPDGEEYQALVLVTDQWLAGEVVKLFASSSIRELRGVSLAVESAEFNPTEKYTQQIQFDVSITWGANSLGDIPTTYEILQASLGTTGFNTLGYRFSLANLPEGNVFHNTMSLNGSFSI